MAAMVITAGSFLEACGDEPTATNKTTTTTLADSPATIPAVRSGTVPAFTPTPTAPEKPEEIAGNFLKAWEAQRYEEMYALLSVSARGYIERDKFVARYTNIAAEATLSNLQTKLGSAKPPAKPNDPYGFNFTANFKTIRAGDFSQQNTLQLVQDDNRWRIDWQPTNIFSGLATGNLVRMIPLNPKRGVISDRSLQPLAKAGVFYTVFVVPGKIENEQQLLDTLSQSLAMDKTVIKDLYKNGQPDWRMDIKRLPGSTPQTILNTLQAVKGVGIAETEDRLYPAGNTAAQTLGYLSSVNAEELTKLAAKGYREDDQIGRAGVEAWAEELLAGDKGGKLTIITPDGGISEKLAEKASVDGSNLALNLDLTIQKNAERILGDKVGSIVVLDVNDGSTLALACNPRYDPNGFILGLSGSQFKALNDDPRHPFQNRPVTGLLPPGSTFKVITMAAALERLGMKPDDRFTCTGHWTGLGEQFAKDCYLKTGHGNITLYQGLVQSCDVVFYELGKKLDETDPLLLPAITKGFGLGSSTGLLGLTDSPGQVPDPQWKKDNLQQAWVRGDAVNLGIGQGYLLVTPLQMAALYAAIGNGGQIPVPRLAARIEKGANSQAYPAKVKQKLPISPVNLDIIRRALADVTISGTGAQAFAGSRVRVAGKTGTAESGKETPHAWFCCYAPTDKPKYAVVIALEEAGFGNEKAAPLARQLIDTLSF
ncbi:penicillin-binding protein 2 [Candidatus Chlorohelix sp.]|uniref:penicillin-binding protein 2 n=1 Tax=Candidatus Chlorohelix sp. TaxID=3139201 RepID=UPI00305ED0D8